MRTLLNNVAVTGMFIAGGLPFPTAAFAQDKAPAETQDSFLYEKGGIAELGLSAGLKLGGSFSQPFGAFGSSGLGELELGYNLPFLKRALGVFISGQYSQPKAKDSGIEDDLGPVVDGETEGSSRLPAPVEYELVQKQGALTLGLIYRVPVGVAMFRPYVAAGGRYYMLKTAITASSGDQAFGKNFETGGAGGFFGALGGELHLGPGAALLEVQASSARVDQLMLRETNAGAVMVSLGYRVFL